MASGLSILEIAGVHRTSPSGIPVLADVVLPFYEQLAARVRPHGMRVFQQLWHAGRRLPQPPRVPELGAERRAQPDGRRGPDADDGGDDRRRRRRVRPRRRPGARRRPRRRRGPRRPRLPRRAVPVPGDEPSRRRLRRLDRGADPLPARGAGGDPRRGRSRVPGRRPPVGRRPDRGRAANRSRRRRSPASSSRSSTSSTSRCRRTGGSTSCSPRWTTRSATSWPRARSSPRRSPCRRS